MKRLLIVLLIMGLLVGSASAWTINDTKNRVEGTIDFYSDGSGVVSVTGGPVIYFTWYQNGDIIRANYLFYGINIRYNATTDELYSPDVEGVVLRR